MNLAIQTDVTEFYVMFRIIIMNDQSYLLNKELLDMGFPSVFTNGFYLVFDCSKFVTKDV